MQAFFQPQSVVLIGVTRQTGVGAYNNLEMLLRYGYRGKVYVVHPKAPEILGIKTYPSVSQLPETPELAVISLGRERVLPVFTECAERGIRHVIVISQGFADADERGKELQQQMVGKARAHGVRIMGPNTMGMLNAFADFSTAFVDIAKEAQPPPLTIVVQSGVFQVGFESFTGHLGKAVDVGNCCDVDFVDVLNFLENDPETRIIVLHMEGMHRGSEFLRVAGRVARHKPIIVLKTGRSTAGARAALSHTGSMVGEDAVFDAACAKAGLLRVRNVMELRAVSQAFLKFRSLTGPRLGVVTATGACGIMAADACEDYGLEIAPPPRRLAEELENPHIAWHRLHNPVDIWPLGMVGGSFTRVFKNAARILLESDRVDAILGIAPALSSPFHEDLDMAVTIREVLAANSEQKPVALWLYGDGLLQKMQELTNEPGVACFAGIDEAVMGLAGMYRYQKLQKQAAGGQEKLESPPRGSQRKASLPPGELLVGESALALLNDYQIPVADWSISESAESAVQRAKEMGYPVVLKIVSPQWLHKSDWGGVRLNVRNDLELKAAYGELLGQFQQRTPDGLLTGILVQKQMQGVELLMGIKRDPQFGPVLVAGMGGIYTEIFKDLARGLAPLSRADAEAMLQSLRIYPILAGVRGQQPVHLPALIETLMALSRLALDYPEISELDLNPVMATADGCWCVDCRVVTL